VAAVVAVLVVAMVVLVAAAAAVIRQDSKGAFSAPAHQEVNYNSDRGRLVLKVRALACQFSIAEAEKSAFNQLHQPVNFMKTLQR